MTVTSLTRPFAYFAHILSRATNESKGIAHTTPIEWVHHETLANSEIASPFSTMPTGRPAKFGIEARL